MVNEIISVYLLGATEYDMKHLKETEGRSGRNVVHIKTIVGIVSVIEPSQMRL